MLNIVIIAMFLNIFEVVMGKKPLSENHVKSLRKLVADNPLHSLLLNLSVDLMLRSSDLLSLKVSDLLHESGKVKSDVKVKTKKTGKTTLSLPLSKNSIDAIKRHLEVSDMDKYVFRGNKSHYTNKPITSNHYARIVKKWMTMLGVEDTSKYSTHSMRKTRPTIIYYKTKNIEVCRRLLAHSNCSATSSYIGIEDRDAVDMSREYFI